MSKTLNRQARESYPFHLEIETRFTDTDMGGHLNNVSILLYYQDGRVPFLLDCFPELAPQTGWGLRLARCDVSYDGQTYYPGPIEVSSGIEQVGDNWVRVAQALFQHGQCVGQCEVILVLAEDEGQPAAFSPAQRARLEARMLGS